MRGKRLVAALTAVMVTVLLTGCESVGDRIGAGNYVRPYSMTKSEKELTQLLRSDDDYTVIGQFKVDDEYKSIQMGADVYKKGKLSGTNESSFSAPLDSKDSRSGKLAVVVRDRMVHLAESNGEGMAGSSRDAAISKNASEKDWTESSSEFTESAKVSDGKKIYLMSLILTDSEQVESYSPEDIAQHPEKVRDYQYVYLFYVTFSKDTTEKSADGTDEE